MYILFHVSDANESRKTLISRTFGHEVKGGVPAIWNPGIRSRTEYNWDGDPDGGHWGTREHTIEG